MPLYWLYAHFGGSCSYAGEIGALPAVWDDCADSGGQGKARTDAYPGRKCGINPQKKTLLGAVNKWFMPGCAGEKPEDRRWGGPGGVLQFQNQRSAGGLPGEYPGVVPTG